MSTGASQLGDSERQRLSDLGWDVESAHQSVPIEHMPEVDEEAVREGRRMALKLSDACGDDEWIALEAEKPILDVSR